MVITDELQRFIRNMVVKTKQFIVANQGGILGHPKFDRNAESTIKRKNSDIAMIDNGKMVGTIQCDLEINNNTITITAISPQDYSSYAQREDKNWDFMTITTEEVNYYAQQIGTMLVKPYE